jgi:chromate transport protein ChrA
MDIASSGITYAFLIIPSAFALIVLAGGIDKITHNQQTEGYIALGFGIVFVILIAAAYFLFIR